MMPDRIAEQFPEDYHDYVFKNGELLGDFDNMYRHARGIPWNQDKLCNDWSFKVGMVLLKQRAPYRSILEIGCGLGYATRKLRPLTSHRSGCIEAFDVSPEAIRRSRSLHPGIHFYVDDIRQPSFQPRRKYDLVVILEVFWYVFPQIQVVVRNIRACLKAHGYLYIRQSFPALDHPFVGKEEIPSPEALVAHFPYVKPVYTAVLRDHPMVEDGPILHFMGVKMQ